MKLHLRSICLWVCSMGCLACEPASEVCQQHLSPLSRLACYDREAARQPTVSSVTHPAPQLTSFALSHDADTITLRRESWSVPASYPYLGEDPLVPLRAGEQVGWKLVGGA